VSYDHVRGARGQIIRLVRPRNLGRALLAGTNC
jgi:hypothetical protein